MATPDLDTPEGRLQWARERKHGDAADFARLAKMKPVTYRAYESGQNGYAKHAALFGRLLGVRSDWLLEGGPIPDRADGGESLSDSEILHGAGLETPSAEVLAPLLADLAPLWPKSTVTDQSLRALAEALSYGLGLLGGSSANRATLGEIRVAALAAIDRAGHLNS